MVLIIVRKIVYLHDHEKKIFMDDIELVFWLYVSRYLAYMSVGLVESCSGLWITRKILERVILGQIIIKMF